MTTKHPKVILGLLGLVVCLWASQFLWLRSADEAVEAKPSDPAFVFELGAIRIESDCEPGISSENEDSAYLGLAGGPFWVKPDGLMIGRAGYRVREGRDGVHLVQAKEGKVTFESTAFVEYNDVEYFKGPQYTWTANTSGGFVFRSKPGAGVFTKIDRNGARRTLFVGGGSDKRVEQRRIAVAAAPIATTTGVGGDCLRYPP